MNTAARRPRLRSSPGGQGGPPGSWLAGRSQGIAPGRPAVPSSPGEELEARSGTRSFGEVLELLRLRPGAKARGRKPGGEGSVDDLRSTCQGEEADLVSLAEVVPHPDVRSPGGRCLCPDDQVLKLEVPRPD